MVLKENFSILTNFNRNYKQIDAIVCKHWPILQKDKTLNSILPTKPLFIYHKVQNLRHNLAPNVAWTKKGFIPVKGVKFVELQKIIKNWYNSNHTLLAKCII